MDRIANIRMVGHQLSVPEFKHPGDLVAWMGAVQAQEYTMAKWALGIRLEAGTLTQVNEALRTGEIVRTHIMRPTWHFVAGKNLRWMLKLSSQRIRKVIDQWTKDNGLDIPESIYTKSNDYIAKLLSGGHHLTREELTSGLMATDIPVSDNQVKRYLLRAEVEGIVCSGGDKAGKPTYALLDELLPSVEDVSREEALGRLALCYFRSHSPATMKDFIWWSGLTTTEAKKAVHIIHSELVKEQWGELEFLIHTSCQANKQTDIVHFLPPFDEYLISYKERHVVMDPKHFSKAFNRWGTFYPVFLYNGQIIGNWRKSVKREKITIETSLFEQAPMYSIPSESISRAENKFREFYK